MHVQINESRGNDQTLGIKFLVRAAPDFVRRSNFRDLAVAQQDVHQRVHPRHWINQVTVANQKTVRL